MLTSVHGRAAHLAATGAEEDERAPQLVEPVSLDEVKEIAVSSGVQTMSGPGFSPVRFRCSTRSGVRTSGFGRVTGGSSKSCAQFLENACSRLIPQDRAELRVLSMRCMVAAEVIFRSPFLPSSRAALAPRKDRRAARRSSIFPAAFTQARCASSRFDCS
ncbi:hypothetical protein [Streptomyces monashensis]|uniref:Uncharacterized protein n=1 Tax=Streptomyces monashensis TaxID=1678012 RepID=A0A1S2QFP0_9ACTN|nr:hypothetical protein [Streptomyces monashensis]OIK04493.1 hypothetical protein BIV23_17200 [Streptomyces monashensis]